MMTLRYNTNGKWFKGNTHIHSTVSDCGKNFAELGQMYADAGFDFLFRTDHWIASDARRDPQHYPLLWLDGVELDGADHGGSPYHVVCLGKLAGITSAMGFVGALEAARAQGALLILAHPHWTGNTIEDAYRWGFHGVELYNHVCQWLNGKGDALVYWNALLARAPATLGVAVDDAHIRPEHPGWNGGWIMVNAAECEPDAILAAIRAGHFYSSCGPEIHSIEYGDGKVTVKTSPVPFVRLVGPGWNGHRVGSFEGELYTEATFRVPKEWPYAYVEIEDSRGRRAWTNAV